MTKKYIHIVIAFALLFTGSGFISQSDIIDDVAAAIKKGDAQKVAQYFDQSVDLTIPGSDRMYSNSQATVILKTFFDNNPPINFEVTHRGTSNQSSRFVMGTYTSKTGKYLTKIFLKTEANKTLIQELKFEKE